jgi:hypothetical protein
MDEPNWARARAAVRDEIVTYYGLQLEQDIAGFLGLNLTTARHFFNGDVEKPSGKTQRKIEKALGWASGRVERIAYGREEPELTPEERAAAIPGLEPEERAEYAQAIRDAQRAGEDIESAVRRTRLRKINGG